MKIDVVSLRNDLLRFASLLKYVARPGPEASVDFEEMADDLLKDSSREALEEIREWLRRALRYTGNNSIFDRYVVVDGKYDTPLSEEYVKLASRLRRYAYSKILTPNPYRVWFSSQVLTKSDPINSDLDLVRSTKELDTDVDSLVRDIVRFASLLKLVGAPGPETASHFENQAESLRADPAQENVAAIAEWLYITLRHTGNGSIFDRYVSGNEYASVDEELTNEYLKLASELRSFGQSYMGRSILSNPEGFTRG